MNVWELITERSTLPISPSNNLWDHLNNLIVGVVTVNEVGGFSVETGNAEVEVSVDQQTIVAFVDLPSISVAVDDSSVDININDQDIGVDL